MQLRRIALPLIALLGLSLGACTASDPAPGPGETPADPPSAADTPGVATSAQLERGQAAAEEAGYECTAGETGEEFIVVRIECVRDADELTLVEYDSAENRGPHIHTWAPRPNRPVDELWLVASDDPRDIDVVAEAMVRP